MDPRLIGVMWLDKEKQRTRVFLAQDRFHAQLAKRLVRNGTPMDRLDGLDGIQITELEMSLDEWKEWCWWALVAAAAPTWVALENSSDPNAPAALAAIVAAMTERDL
jgi:hypothetical protein